MDRAITKSEHQATPRRRRRLRHFLDVIDLYRSPPAFFERIRRTRGDLAPFRIGVEPAVLVSDPEAIKRLLLDDERRVGKSEYTKLMGAVFGDCLLTAEGEAWAGQRAALNPLFSPKAIRAWRPVIQEEAQAAVGALAAHAENGTPASANAFGKSVVQKIMGRILFGDLFPRHEIDALMTAMQHINDGLFGLFFRSRVLKGPLKVIPTPGARRLARATQQFDAFIDRLQRIKIPAGDPAIASQLAGLVREGVMTPCEMRGQIAILYYAGQDTTAQALAWLLYELARRPEWQTKIRNDADDGDAAMRCIRETLRLHPPAYAIDRRVKRAVSLPGGDIPAGLTTPLNIYGAHRHDAHWRDPALFDPNRFTAEDRKGRHVCAYAPFGHGARKCIGASLAELELAIIVSALCRAYAFTLHDPRPIGERARVTLAPHPDVLIRLDPLTRASRSGS